MYVVTGASDGLGLEIVKLLVANGKQVIGLSRGKPSIGGLQWIQMDLLDVASIEAAAQQVVAFDEPVEALINCAGVLSFEPLGAISSTELDRILKTNTTGPILLTSRLAGRIKQDGADIVNVASTVGTKAYKDQAAYGSSKWAMRGFSANLQLELADTRSRVISFCIGGFRSKIAEKVTGHPMADPENWMATDEVAKLLVQLLELPKNMEVSEIIVNRRAVR